MAKERKKALLDMKAMNVLYSSLSFEEFNHISSCETFKEIWNILSINYQRTNKVKKSRINYLLLEYELFEMRTDKIICEMYNHFINIVANL